MRLLNTTKAFQEEGLLCGVCMSVGVRGREHVGVSAWGCAHVCVHMSVVCVCARV